MTHRLVLLAIAAREIEDARDWYEAERVGLGDEFGRALDDVLGAIATRPLSFPPWSADATFRRAHLSRFPYTSFFRVTADRVEVVAVAHQRRKPGAWLARR